MSNTGKKFNLTELLNQRSKEVAEPVKQGQQTEEVTMIKDIISTVDIYDLVPSKDNFYSVEDVGDLKQSIELLGVLQPLLVTEEEEDGTHRIIAGHRRHIALKQLVSEGKEKFRKVPILVISTQNVILDRLALIMTNRFREKTDWEKMTEALETEELVLKLKETTNIRGKTRDLLAEILKKSPAQIGRYKAIYNNLIPELMSEFKSDKIVVSVIYEVSGMTKEYQQRAAELFKGNGSLSLSDVKQLKKDYEEAQQIPVQNETFTDNDKQEQRSEFNLHESEKHAEGEKENVEQGKASEEFDPQPDTVTSLCYSCIHYEECHEKRSTVTSCNDYINRREANKTEEERYNEEQAAIDRETKRKLRDRQQEEKMQHLPSDEKPKERDIRVSRKQYEEITSGVLTFLLLKKDNFKIGEEIELSEYKEGQQTGRKIDIEIIYILEDWTGLESDYCIIGFNVTAFDA